MKQQLCLHGGGVEEVAWKAAHVSLRCDEKCMSTQLRLKAYLFTMPREGFLCCVIRKNFFGKMKFRDLDKLKAAFLEYFSRLNVRCSLVGLIFHRGALFSVFTGHEAQLVCIVHGEANPEVNN
jgi:hypothetical protein